MPAQKLASLQPARDRRRRFERRGSWPSAQLLSGPPYRLSRHAIRYKEDLRTSSKVVLDMPMSVRSRSSSSKSSFYWHRCSQACAIWASHANQICHQPTSGKAEGASIVYVELDAVLPQVMFHLRIGAKQRLAAGAHRAVVKGPSDFCIMSAAEAQALALGWTSICWRLRGSPRH